MTNDLWQKYSASTLHNMNTISYCVQLRKTLSSINKYPSGLILQLRRWTNLSAGGSMYMYILNRNNLRQGEITQPERRLNIKTPSYQYMVIIIAMSQMSYYYNIYLYTLKYFLLRWSPVQNSLCRNLTNIGKYCIEPTILVCLGDLGAIVEAKWPIYASAN